MSDFFNSDMVKQTMIELEFMQRELLIQTFQVETFSLEEKKQYIQLMKDYLEKQKVLFFRMSLSEDPDAQTTKNEIIKSIEILGLTKNETIDDFFNILEKRIEMVEKSLNM